MPFSTEVAHCFGHGAEGRGALDPAHGAGHGDAYELWLVGMLGQEHSKAQAG